MPLLSMFLKLISRFQVPNPAWTPQQIDRYNGIPSEPPINISFVLLLSALEPVIFVSASV